MNDSTIHPDTPQRDRGFSLVEMLVVIVVLGVIATITVVAVRGKVDAAERTSCATVAATVRSAADAYFVQYVGTGQRIATAAYPADTAYTGNPAQAAIAAPAGVTAGATPAETLRNAGLLRSIPQLVWVSPTGEVVSLGGTCGPVGQPVTG